MAALFAHGGWVAGEVIVFQPVNDDGILVHSVQSPDQTEKTTIHVLLPDPLLSARRYPVLYVLPVEALDGKRWGDAMRELKKSGLHNRYGLICVYPTFSQLPWYCDHATDTSIRQESYFLNVVLPFVRRSYPTVGTAQARLLVGFSKSGWGAYSLLLRHPDQFGRAAAWDAPLMMDQPKNYGTRPIFGTQENFEGYCISSLLRQSDTAFRRQHRLVLLGYGNFRDHHRSAHALMNELAVLHVYRDGPQRQHAWDSGWLDEAVSLLVADKPANTD